MSIPSFGLGTFRLKTDGDKQMGERVFELAKDRGWTLSEIRSEDASLEEVFHQLTAVN